MSANIVKYHSMTGQEIILSPEIVRNYLVNGDPTKVTDQEIMMFLTLCKYQKLNPFLREAYLIKYGNKMTIVTGKETFLKRAVKNPNYQGHRTGITEDGQTAWAEVYVQGYEVPIKCEVDYQEYVGTKDEYKNGKPTGRKIPNQMWSEKPRTMLKKVALVQALREAFPEDFGGMYSPEEINTIKDELPTNEVIIESEKELPMPSKSSTVKPATEKPKGNKISEAQVKRFYALAKGAKWEDDALKSWLKKQYGYESSRDIEKNKMYQEICDAVQKRPDGVSCTTYPLSCEKSIFIDKRAYCGTKDKPCPNELEPF